MHKKYIPNKDLLDALLAGPYSHFKKIGADDWRDPNQNNSSLSISEKGYIDHKSGMSGSLWDLGKQHNLMGMTTHPKIIHLKLFGANLKLPSNRIRDHFN